MEPDTNVLALSQHLDCDRDAIDVSSYDENVLSCGSMEYLVVTDDETDKLWDDALESYIDECILPEMPEHLRNYFDDESWKRDARYDGRGHCLATYDGDENEEDVIDIDGDKVTLYIYRTN